MKGVELAVRARQIRLNIKVLLTAGYAHGALAAHYVPRHLPMLAKPYRVERLSAQFIAARSGKLQARGRGASDKQKGCPAFRTSHDPAAA
jgi:hypothetical protein